MQKNVIADEIILFLSNGPRRSTDTVGYVAKKHGLTIQAVYATLRKLKSEGVVLSQKKILSLNTVWIEEQVNLLERIQIAYLDELQPDTFAFGDMEDGDRISYRFKNPVLLDQMWGHLFLVLVERTVPHMPIMIYMSHNWFPIAREESERTIFKWLEEQGFRAYFSVGGDAQLDLDVCKEFLANMHHTYSLNVDLGMKVNQYLNVIGDYLIQVTMDEEVSADIHDYFLSYNTMHSANIDELKKMVARKGDNKLVITKNSKKAKRLRAKMAREYLIPEESRKFV